jgi:hypothetical protein
MLLVKQALEVIQELSVVIRDLFDLLRYLLLDLILNLRLMFNPLINLVHYFFKNRTNTFEFLLPLNSRILMVFEGGKDFSVYDLLHLLELLHSLLCFLNDNLLSLLDFFLGLLDIIFILN